VIGFRKPPSSNTGKSNSKFHSPAILITSKLQVNRENTVTGCRSNTAWYTGSGTGCATFKVWYFLRPRSEDENEHAML
jgi:hypothetical protein